MGLSVSGSASISVKTNENGKALIKIEAGPQMSVQFNPKELQIDKSVSWTNAQGPATEDPAQEFKEPQSRSLSCTLYFDSLEQGADINGYIKTLERTVTIVDSLKRPPMVIFQWGSFNFTGVVESLSQKYTMFLPDGRPCRAEVGLKMKSASAAKVGTKTTEGGSGSK